MKGRPKHYEQEILLKKAAIVFWQKGYASSSAKDLMNAMDIGQGSLYLHFKGGKKELFEKSLLYFAESSLKFYKDGLLKSDDAIQFLKDFFYSTLNRTETQKENGCFIGNSIIEFSNLDAATKKLSETLLYKLELQFIETLKKAKQQNLIDNDANIENLATFFINLWNGINITIRMNKTPESIKKVIDINFKIIN